MELTPNMPAIMESTFTSLSRFGPMVLTFLSTIIFIEVFFVAVLHQPGPIFGALGSNIFRDESGGRR